MILLLLKRIGFMLFTMVVVSIILFLLLETGLTGDPATRVLGNFASDEQKEMWRDQHGYNQPVIVRYAKWLGNFATGNLGTSIRYKGPVKEVLMPRLWNTAILRLLDLCPHDPFVINFRYLVRNEGGFHAGSNHIRFWDFNHLGAGICQCCIFLSPFCIWVRVAAGDQQYGRRV